MTTDLSKLHGGPNGWAELSRGIKNRKEVIKKRNRLIDILKGDLRKAINDKIQAWSLFMKTHAVIDVGKLSLPTRGKVGSVQWADDCLADYQKKSYKKGSECDQGLISSFLADYEKKSRNEMNDLQAGRLTEKQEKRLAKEQRKHAGTNKQAIGETGEGV